MTGALDMSLDDMIGSSSYGRKGGKKGGGKGKSRGEGGGSWSSSRGGGDGGGASKDDKLDMALDDVIGSNGDGRKGKGKGWKDSSKGSWGGSRSWDDDDRGSKGSKGKGWSSSWSPKGGGKDKTPSWMEHDDQRGEASSDSWGHSGGGGSRGGGGKDSWGGRDSWGGDWHKKSEGSRGGGDRDRDHWVSRDDEHDDRKERYSSRRDRDDDRDRGSSWRRVEQPAERPASRGPVSGMKRGREETTSSRHVKRIKVTNVPSDLEATDIKEAFEAEAGRTTSCSLKRGVAYLEFTNAEDARKAVETFDRGELNGKTITVTLEP